MYKVYVHAGAIRKVLNGCWLCVCTGDNPLAKARGLSSRPYAQTIRTIKELLVHMGETMKFFNTCIISIQLRCLSVRVFHELYYAFVLCKLRDLCKVLEYYINKRCNTIE